MQSDITCQIRMMPGFTSAVPRAAAFRAFICAIVSPEAAAISSISAAVLNG